MNVLQALLALNRRGIDHIADAAGCSVDELMEWGAATQDAEILQHLASVYFDPGAGVGHTKIQRECVILARTHLLSIRELETIENYAKRARNKRDAWTLRKLLITTPAKHRKKVANKKLAELNPPKPQKPDAKITRSKNNDNWKIILNGPSDRVSGIWDSLDDKTFEGFEEALYTGTTRPSYIPHVIIPIDQLKAIKEGEGDDVILQMTNGATMSGAVFAEATLADYGFASLVDPEEGPVNLYRLSRFANFKQRTLLAAEHIRCVWPDCNKPADECQMHHITAWKHGGETNLNNLVPLCAYHNGVNNDEHTSDGRGYITKHKRKVIWHPPDTS